MNKLFRKFSYVLTIGLIAALIAGCVKKPEKSQIVAQVNDYMVTVEDFKYEAEMSIPGASKELILQDIVTKELLLQEAQKMQLDKNKLFMKEIEDYWKQSLIKRLITIKGEEFFALAQVSAEEMRAEYSRMSQESAGKIKPFVLIVVQIQETLKARKAQLSLDKWVSSLRKNAQIKNYEAVFNGIIVGGSDGK